MAVEALNKRPAIRDNQLAMTAEVVRDRYLFAVDLTTDLGDGYKKSDLEFQIRSAQEWIQKELPGVLLFETEIVGERHDYYINDYMAYNFIKLFRTPVQSVSSIEIQFPMSQNTLKIDEQWYRVDSHSGHAQLVPTSGAFSSIALGQGGNFLPMFYQGNPNVPSIWSITYKAGFKKGEIPEDILDLIGLKASIQPLAIAGDLIAGAGIASKTISMDGLSQSIATTASAENNGYSATIKQREKEIVSKLRGLKEYYNGIQMAVI